MRSEEKAMCDGEQTSKMQFIHTTSETNTLYEFCIQFVHTVYTWHRTLAECMPNEKQQLQKRQSNKSTFTLTM